MDDEGARKFDGLRRWDQHTAAAVEWLRNNQSKFKKRVIEPAALSVSVKDLHFASAVETGCNAAQLKVYTNPRLI